MTGRCPKNLQGTTPAVMEILMRHDFPGNVRELENLIEHGFVLCHEGSIDVCWLCSCFVGTPWRVLDAPCASRRSP